MVIRPSWISRKCIADLLESSVVPQVRVSGELRQQTVLGESVFERHCSPACGRAKEWEFKSTAFDGRLDMRPFELQHRALASEKLRPIDVQIASTRMLSKQLNQRILQVLVVECST